MKKIITSLLTAVFILSLTVVVPAKANMGMTGSSRTNLMGPKNNTMDTKSQMKKDQMRKMRKMNAMGSSMTKIGGMDSMGRSGGMKGMNTIWKYSMNKMTTMDRMKNGKGMNALRPMPMKQMKKSMNKNSDMDDEAMDEKMDKKMDKKMKKKKGMNKSTMDVQPQNAQTGGAMSGGNGGGVTENDPGNM